VAEQTLRILAAGLNDDERIALAAVLDQQSDGRAEVTAADTAATTIAWLKEHDCDVLLVKDSLGLPGPELLREMRRRHKRLFVALVSGHDDALARDAMRAGVNCMLPTADLSNGKFLHTIRCALCWRRKEEAFQAQHEKVHQLERELLQSQKMDTLGQLTGGVVHDFNNLLMVISSYAELSLEKLSLEDPLHRNVTEIQKAARCAAGLTRQLLAFSRKQEPCSQLLDVNTVLAELERMLSRLIGEDIELVINAAKEPCRIKADPIQIKQIVINLAANARDAMPQGGKLAVETASIDVSETYIQQSPTVPPGRYVVLSVSDSGQGISAQVLSHMFEPFFTTKKEGKGTGLGLATVKAIVSQCGGYTEVFSELGRGTTFKIYLPRVAESEDGQTGETQRGSQAATRAGSIIFVEDETAARQPASEFLRLRGYSVLEAADGEEAIRLSDGHAGALDILVTDLVMPSMSGTALADRLTKTRPEMKVLYISGYAGDMLADHGLSGDVPFLQKPFTLRALAQEIHDVLAHQSKPEISEPFRAS